MYTADEMPVFDDITYYENKVKQLNKDRETHDGIKPGYWNIENLKQVLTKYGFTAKSHYIKFGLKEGVCPYYGWSDRLYLENKVKQLNDSGETHSGVEPGQWTVSNLNSVLRNVGMNIMQHFERHGRREGIAGYTGIIPRPGLAPTVLEGGEYKYYGNGTCCFLKRELVQIFNDVVASLRNDYPNKPLLIIGDASTNKNDVYARCPGHPTHNHLSEVDIDYPLYSGNSTQYGPDPKPNEMWESRSPGNMILKEQNIDWEMIYQLLIRLKHRIDKFHQTTYDTNNGVQTQFIIHEKVYDLIRKNLETQIERNEFHVITNRDYDRKFNHDTHIHLRLWFS